MNVSAAPRCPLALHSLFVARKSPFARKVAIVDLHPDRKKKEPEKKKAKALLFGLGLDSNDEHVRVTQGINFHLLGGSKDTHESMQETAIKFNEELRRRGRHLNELSPKEFNDIMQKLK
jgi:hypothetical protein